MSLNRMRVAAMHAAAEAEAAADRRDRIMAVVLLVILLVTAFAVGAWVTSCLR